MRVFIPLQMQPGFRVSGILFVNMLLPVIVDENTVFFCGTRPWSAGGGRGELTHHLNCAGCIDFTCSLASPDCCPRRSAAMCQIRRGPTRKSMLSAKL